MAAALPAGFAEPVLDSQRVFRAVMDALARPGSIQALRADLAPPAPLTPELAAIALTLADHEAPLWLDAPLAAAPAVADYLRFHSGAAVAAEPADAAFALIADAAQCPPFETFAPGTPDYPDRSATLVLAVSALTNDGGFVLRGPGIAQQARLAPRPLPPDMAARLRANHARFPRGVDCLFVAPGCVAGLPRSTEIVEA